MASEETQETKKTEEKQLDNEDKPLAASEIEQETTTTEEIEEAQVEVATEADATEADAGITDGKVTDAEQDTVAVEAQVDVPTEGVEETINTEAGDDAGAERETEEDAPPTQSEENAAEGADHEQEPSNDHRETLEEEKETLPVSRDDLFEEDQGPIVTVGAPLSRTTSQIAVEDGVMLEVPSIRPSTPIKSTTPVEMESAAIEEEYEGGMDRVDRNELISHYQEALMEREKIFAANNQLQHRLADYFRRKKTDEHQEVEKSVTDQEQRYVKCLGALEEHEMELSHIQQQYEEQLAELKEKRQEKLSRVDAAAADFRKFKHEQAKAAINTRSGKPMQEKDIEVYEAQEAKKEQEVIAVRLENIKLKNKLKKKEMQLKQKEELADGLHLIDFEQLKIENQTYNEKIEERNEELLKLRKKITSTVQVLTHVKEKLQFMQAENTDRQRDLDRIDTLHAEKRDILTRTKQARDALRMDNSRLRAKCGLLGQESLLRDFEERRDESEHLRSRLDELKLLHTQLTLDCDGLRQKIEQSKQAKTF